MAMQESSTPTGARVTEASRQRFEALWRGSRDHAFRAAYRVVANRSVAEDIAQEAFARAWQNFDRFDADGSFGAWIYRIVTNLAISHVRDRSRYPTCSLSSYAPDGDTLDVPDALADPHRSAVLSAQAEQIRLALRALPAASRETILLADAEQYSYEEVARLMGCPIGTVRSRIHRARAMLRSVLTDLAA